MFIKIYINKYDLNKPAGKQNCYFIDPKITMKHSYAAVYPRNRLYGDPFTIMLCISTYSDNYMFDRVVNAVKHFLKCYKIINKFSRPIFINRADSEFINRVLRCIYPNLINFQNHTDIACARWADRYEYKRVFPPQLSRRHAFLPHIVYPF